jgi:hypothetical protein
MSGGIVLLLLLVGYAAGVGTWLAAGVAGAACEKGSTTRCPACGE